MEVLDATNLITVPESGTIRIMPLGDLQWGTPDTNIKLIKERIDYGMKNRCYFIGMGDYVDFMSPSNRSRIQAADLYDNSQNSLDEWMEEELGEVYQLLKPTRGRWLGLLHGHHLWNFLDGQNSDQKLAEMLGAPYLGTTAMVGVKFPKMGTLVLWATHGAGGGATSAGHLGKLEKIVQTFEAHIYLMAHVTKLAAARPQRIVVNWKTGEVAFVNLLIASTGGFMQGYTPHRKLGSRPAGSYVEQKMMPPVGLGSPMITITPALQKGIFSPDIRIET